MPGIDVTLDGPEEFTPAFYLRQERERIGLTQAQLASKLGIGIRALQSMELLPEGPLAKLKTHHFAQLARMGMDVNPILTGGRVIPLCKEYLGP